MAIRINTIEYGWETNKSTVSGSTVYTSPSKSISIAESSSRTFVAADLHLYVRDGASGTTILTAPKSASLGLWIDNNYVTQSIDFLSQAVDHIFFKFFAPFNSHFNTYFTGSNHTIQYTFQQPTASGALPFTNHAGKLIITYQYDDTNLITATKTVRIPLESHTSYTNITASIHGNSTVSGSSTFRNIPLLDTYLPENNKVYTDIFFEIHSKDASNATTAVSMSLTIDSGSESVRSVFSSSLNTSLYSYDIYNVSGSMVTSASHVFKSRSSLANRFTNTSPILNVTYTYNYSSSNRILNSLILPVSNLNNNPEFNYRTTPYYRKCAFIIPENNPIMAQSSIFMYSGYSNSTTSLTFRNTGIIFTTNVGSIEVGMTPICWNIDSASIGVTIPGLNVLSRGLNTLTYSDVSNIQNNTWTVIQRILILNYFSDNHNPGRHNKTIYLPATHSYKSSAAYTNRPFNPLNNRLHQDITGSYFITNVVRQFSDASTGGNGTVPQVPQLIVDYTGSLFQSSGSYNYYTMFLGDNRQGHYDWYLDISSLYQSTPYAIYSYSNPQLSYFSRPRYDYLSNTGVATVNSLVTIIDYLTINHMTNYVSCSLTNTNYSNKTYDVYFYLSGSASSPINILSISGSTVNKSGSFDWYDNFQNIYAVCYSPEFGISNMLPAGSGSHTINFSTASAGTGGEKSFTFIG